MRVDKLFVPKKEITTKSLADNIEDTQKAVINVARTMSDEGTIVLAGRGGDDFV